MDVDRSLALLAHEDQWARCAHRDTVLLPGGGVGLTWDEAPPPPRWDADRERCDPPARPPEPACPAGITHDRWCRTWRTRPLEGSLEVSRRREAPDTGCPGGLRHPTGVALDDRDRLYVAETGARVVLVGDLWSGRVLRRIPVAGTPLDVVARGAGPDAGVLVLTHDPDAVLRVSGRTGPCPGPGRLHPPCGRPGLRPARLTVLAGMVVVLWQGAGTAVVADLAGTELLEAARATDLEGSPAGLLVVALRPGDPIRRYRLEGGVLVEDEPLAAAGYDGGAVTIDPGGRVVYTTATGRRTTQGSQARHVRLGHVTTYRLDSFAYRTRWGRVFLDACLPTGTALRVRAVTSDDDDVDDALSPSPPVRGNRPVRSPELTPPLPPVGALDAAVWLPVVRREHQALLGSVEPLAGGAWQTYETGVAAPPGRYLWLQLELSGTEHTSPKVRAVQVERPGHALLAALPRLYSSDDTQADFLHGFLTAAEGHLHDLDTAAAERRALVDPTAVPTEALAWLASLAGVALDLRWPEAARRALVAEAYRLYARRGTAGMLERLLRLYLGRDARIVERWRLRGLGGGFLGLDPGGLDAPTVAGRARTGRLGTFTIGGELPSTSSYERLAHRFTVLVPGRLTPEQREVVDDLVRTHKPSHTVGDVCELGDGLPVGRLRVGLTSYVGPPRGRPNGLLGEARLGSDGTLGTPACGSRVGETRLGGVRVG